MTTKQLILVFFTSMILISSCSKEEIFEDTKPPVESQQPVEDDKNENGEDEPNKQTAMIVKVEGKTYTVTLEDNATSAALKALLPLTLNMSELNGNEKYHYLENNLPTATSSIISIEKGDIMLYGSNCLVVFYKTFNTSYSYTRIGHINNADDIDTTLGSSSVSVIFE